MIDVPDALLSYVPNDLLKTAVKMSHITDSIEAPFEKEDVKSAYEIAEEQFELYKNNAKLIVTSRLHCAAPCMAMGIPVIIVKKNRDINMSWIDKIVDIYTEDEFDNINWNCKAVEIEELKKLVLNAFQAKVNEILSYRQHYYTLSHYYESREQKLYNDKLLLKLKGIVESIKKVDFTYVLWGLGDGGNIAFQLIQANYPKARCILAVDRYKRGKFYQHNIQEPEMIDDVKTDYVFVTTYNGRKDATELLKRIGKEKYVDWEFLISRVGGEDQYFS